MHVNSFSFDHDIQSDWATKTLEQIFPTQRKQLLRCIKTELAKWPEMCTPEFDVWCLAGVPVNRGSSRGNLTEIAQLVRKAHGRSKEQRFQIMAEVVLKSNHELYRQTTGGVNVIAVLGFSGALETHDVKFEAFIYSTKTGKVHRVAVSALKLGASKGNDKALVRAVREALQVPETVPVGIRASEVVQNSIETLAVLSSSETKLKAKPKAKAKRNAGRGRKKKSNSDTGKVWTCARV